MGLADAGRSYPWQLSGGMQQRVAIARALACQPDLLLMDEPFASVDAQTRFGLEDLILRVRDEFGVTVVFVTHDIDEAVYLADRVIVLSASPGVVSEVIDIALPRPRDQVATKRDETFAAYREHLLGLVMTRPACGRFCGVMLEDAQPCGCRTGPGRQPRSPGRALLDRSAAAGPG